MMYAGLALVFFVLMLVYFRIASAYNIIDKPNERSSHTSITIRGGGIIFIAAACVVLVWHYNEFALPAAGIIIIGVVSFIDDVKTLSNRVRYFFHLSAVTLMFIFLQVFSQYPVYIIVPLYILVTGILNAYNFMDGINGITGLYSVVALL